MKLNRDVWGMSQEPRLGPSSQTADTRWHGALWERNVTLAADAPGLVIPEQPPK